MKIIENRMKAFLFSFIVIAIGIGMMAYHGSQGNGMLNWDIEFTGGTSFEIDMAQAYDKEALLDVIEEVTGENSPQIQEIMNTHALMVKMKSIDSEMRVLLTDRIEETFEGAEIISSADVSGVVSQQMQETAIKAILVACVAMLIYISIRFQDVRAGGSAIIALVHDILMVLTAYSVLRIPVDNAFIAVLLTVLGYSVNATIVIFDRVRENQPHFRPAQTIEKMNISVQQTLGRSIHTSITTFFAVGSIYFLGVQSIKEFALPMMVGIVAGIYSSIFISAPVWYTFIKKAMEQAAKADIPAVMPEGMEMMMAEAVEEKVVSPHMEVMTEDAFTAEVTLEPSVVEVKAPPIQITTNNPEDLANIQITTTAKPTETAEVIEATESTETKSKSDEKKSDGSN